MTFFQSKERRNSFFIFFELLHAFFFWENSSATTLFTAGAKIREIKWQENNKTQSRERKDFLTRNLNNLVGDYFLGRLPPWQIFSMSWDFISRNRKSSYMVRFFYHSKELHTFSYSLMFRPLRRVVNGEVVKNVHKNQNHILHDAVCSQEIMQNLHFFFSMKEGLIFFLCFVNQTRKINERTRKC